MPVKKSCRVFFVTWCGSTGDEISAAKCSVRNTEAVEKYSWWTVTLRACGVILKIEMDSTAPSKLELRSVIKFLTAEHCSEADIHRWLRNVYGENNGVFLRTVEQWQKWFQESRIEELIVAVWEILSNLGRDFYRDGIEKLVPRLNMFK